MHFYIIAWLRRLTSSLGELLDTELGVRLFKNLFSFTAINVTILVHHLMKLFIFVLLDALGIVVDVAVMSDSC